MLHAVMWEHGYVACLCTALPFTRMWLTRLLKLLQSLFSELRCWRCALSRCRIHFLWKTRGTLAPQQCLHASRRVALLLEVAVLGAEAEAARLQSLLPTRGARLVGVLEIVVESVRQGARATSRHLHHKRRKTLCSVRAASFQLRP